MATAGTLFGYAVRSGYPLRRLSAAPPRRGELEIRRGDAVDLGEAAMTHELATSEGGLTIAREPSGALLVRCSLAGGFRIDAARRRILAERDEADEVWEHRLVTLVVPLLVSELGDVALHAAGVVRSDRAIVFVGPSTRGKSTLAWAAAGLGLGLLADDAVVVERGDAGALAWPGPEGLNVAAPGFARKRVRATAVGCVEPVRLGAIAVLGPRVSDGPTVERLEPVPAVPALVPSLIFSGSDRLVRAMGDAAHLASRVPVFRCGMPDDVGRLPAALTTVLDLVTGDAGG